jgi:hypothetical protein
MTIITHMSRSLKRAMYFILAAIIIALGLTTVSNSAYAASSSDKTAKTAESIMTCMKTKSFCDGGVLTSKQRESMNDFMSENQADGRMKILVMETNQSKAYMQKTINSYFKDTSALDKKAYGIMVIVFYDDSSKTAQVVVNGMSDETAEFKSSVSKITSDSAYGEVKAIQPYIASSASSMVKAERKTNIWNTVWQWLGYVALAGIALLTILFVAFIGRKDKKSDHQADANGAVV